MLCWVALSSFTKWIVLGWSAGRVIGEVSNAIAQGVTAWGGGPAPPAPTTALAAASASAPRGDLDLADHRRMHFAVECVGAFVERRHIVGRLVRTGDELTAEGRLARGLLAREDHDVVLGRRVLVVERERERLAGGRLDAIALGERDALRDHLDRPVHERSAFRGRRWGRADRAGRRRAGFGERHVLEVPVPADDQVTLRGRVPREVGH